MHLVTNHKISIFIILIIVITLMILPNHSYKIKSYAYGLLRNLSKIHMELVTNSFDQLSSDKFFIRYKDINSRSARLVGETGDEIFKPVNEMLDFTPQGPIPVIIYPSMEALNKSFGWEGDKSPMGVYWMGTIRVLNPEAWIEEKDNKEQALIFKAMGPMAHEYAHLVVDYKTSGNYTRWLTEGIAQYIEKQLTGFTLDEPTKEAKADIYSFNKLDRDFDEQKNQDLAYWQSLIAIEYLVDKYGESIINKLLEELAQGESLNTVFIKVLGEDLVEFEENIRVYALTEV